MTGTMKTELLDADLVARVHMISLARWLACPDRHDLDDDLAAVFGTNDVMHLALGLRHVLLEETKVSAETLINYLPARVDLLVHRATMLLYGLDDREHVPQQFFGWVERLVQSAVVEISEPDDCKQDLDSQEIYRRGRVAGVVVGAFAKHMYHSRMDSPHACWYLMSNIDWEKAEIKPDDQGVDYPLLPSNWAANFFLECIRQSEQDERGAERWVEASVFMKRGTDLSVMARGELMRIEMMRMQNCVPEQIDEQMSLNAVAWMKKIVRGNVETARRGVRAPLLLVHRGIYKTSRFKKRAMRDISLNTTFGEARVTIAR